MKDLGRLPSGRAATPSGPSQQAVSGIAGIPDAITPLPWALFHREPRKGCFGEVPSDFIHAGPEPKDDTGFNVVARAYTTHGYDGVAEREANAAYIVRACNSFPELLEALSWFVADERFQVAVGGNPNVVERMITDARAIYAKATGAA